MSSEKPPPQDFDCASVYSSPPPEYSPNGGAPAGLLDLTSWSNNVKIVCNQSLLDNTPIFVNLKQALSRKQGVKPSKQTPMSDGFTTLYYTTEGRSFTREQIAHQLFVGGWKSFGYSCTYHEKSGDLVYCEKWAKYG